MEEIITLGPWGGRGGSKWSQCGDSAVRKIVIVHGDAIDSIKFLTKCDGREKWSKLNGGSGGTAKIEPDPVTDTDSLPGEYITSISGHIGEFNGYKVLRSLTFSTNFEVFGPYGRKEGTHFWMPINGGVIVGLHGRSGQYMDALGIFVKPIRDVFYSNNGKKMCFALAGTALESPSLEFVQREVNRPLPTAWGGSGGQPWEDGVFSGIKQIYIHTDGSAINAIEVLYKRGSTDISCIHSRACGFKYCGIDLDLDETEHLVSISGYYGTTEDTEGWEVIKSLTFFTNKSKRGPIGAEVGKYFCTAYSSAVCGEVVGFFGRSSSYLDAIGVHMRYF